MAEVIWQRLQQMHDQGKLPHALSFSGEDGEGTLRTAWSLAQRLLCEGKTKLCGECGPCRRVLKRQSENVMLIEPDGVAIKLESAHDVLAFLSLQKIGRARVVILNQAQKLNPQAANALLKVIEEPPQDTYFVLVVPEFSQLMPTLRSRCQVIRFPNRGVRVVPDTEEHQTLKSAILDFLNQGLNGDRQGLGTLLENVRDRESALAAIQILQEVLRDWSTLGAGEALHPDLTEHLKRFPEIAGELRVELWRSAFQMELDLLANVDRSLIFENFFCRAKNTLVQVRK